MFENATINRDACSLVEAIQLQKLRAISHILDITTNEKFVHVFTTIECLDDVYVKKVDTRTTEIKLEQDKNYNPESSFSFNSAEVLKFMVNNCDIWIKSNFSTDELSLNFYATNGIGKERICKQTTAAEVTLPDGSIIELLAQKQFYYKNLLDSVKKLTIYSYRKEYEKHPEKRGGNIDIIERWKDDDWVTLLKLITWHWQQSDTSQLENEIIQKIKKSPYYSQNLLGHESNILDKLKSILEKKLSLKDRLERFLSNAEVQVVFLTQTPEYLIDKKLDPVWEMWQHLPPPIDKRNFKEKIINVCQNFPDHKIRILSRKIAIGKYEENTYCQEKEFLALKYRVLVKCQNILDEKSYNEDLTEEQLASQISELVKMVSYGVNELIKDFRYSLFNNDAIEHIILNLFDTCFLAFDEGLS